MSRAERAKEYFMQGYTCSQAVALAFSDVMKVEEATIAKMLLPFGGGIGRLRLTCGAVSGMVAVLGALYAKTEQSAENKKYVYSIVQEACGQFKEEFGSLICGELLAGVKIPVEVGGAAEVRTESYYKKRPCGDMVAFAAKLIDEYIRKNPIE